MTTKIKQTDHGTWIVYEGNGGDSDNSYFEYDEFNTVVEAAEYLTNLEEVATWLGDDTDGLE